MLKCVQLAHYKIQCLHCVCVCLWSVVSVSSVRGVFQARILEWVAILSAFFLFAFSSFPLFPSHNAAQNLRAQNNRLLTHTSGGKKT